MHAAIYCGSFVAMSSAPVLPDREQLGFAAALSGVVLVALEGVLYGGWGGKGGTVAFLGVVLTQLAAPALQSFSGEPSEKSSNDAPPSPGGE